MLYFKKKSYYFIFPLGKNIFFNRKFASENYANATKWNHFSKALRLKRQVASFINFFPILWWCFVHESIATYLMHAITWGKSEQFITPTVWLSSIISCLVTPINAKTRLLKPVLHVVWNFWTKLHKIKIFVSFKS